MRKIIPLLLLASSCLAPVLEAANSVAIQQLTRVNTVPPAITARIVQTQGQVLKLQDMVLKANEQAKTDPAAQQQAKDAQQKLEEAQKAAEAAAKQAAPSPEAPKFVPPDQRQHLMNLVSEFYQEVKQAAKSASAWEVTLIISIFALGLLGSIFSILNKNKAAAIASALVVVASGIPKLFPIHQRAVYYRTLTNQSYSLMGNLQIPYQMSAAEYDDGVSRLKVLDEYRATKYPETGDLDGTTQALFNDLNAVKTAQVEKH
jgi:hypothetical protein